jgi:Txe/YoeB family toxin of Txe-Axe toxin-antitoxin module
LRLNSTAVFDVGGSSIFPIVNEFQILGNFACKITKYIGKNWIDHTVNFQVDEVKEIPFFVSENQKIVSLVSRIIEKQKQNPRYDYMSNEQKEIDKLVYEMYGLNKDDIREVETWYARRYPKLAKFCNIN